MTIDEAKKILNRTMTIRYALFSEEKVDTDDAIMLAIKALEKQIPKKIKETSFGTECSVCGSLVKIRGCAKFAYCPYCGNKIDWTKEGAESDD